jgi:hypothetical protein
MFKLCRNIKNGELKLSGLQPRGSARELRDFNDGPVNVIIL